MRRGNRLMGATFREEGQTATVQEELIHLGIHRVLVQPLGKLPPSPFGHILLTHIGQFHLSVRNHRFHPIELFQHLPQKSIQKLL